MLLEYSVGLPISLRNGLPISALDLHMHHTHLTPSRSVPLHIPISPWYLYHTGKPKIYEHHNEMDPCGVTRVCHTESEPPGFGRLLDVPLDLDMEIVNGLPNEPFFLQFAIRWSTDAKFETRKF